MDFCRHMSIVPKRVAHIHRLLRHTEKLWQSARIGSDFYGMCLTINIGGDIRQTLKDEIVFTKVEESVFSSLGRQTLIASLPISSKSVLIANQPTNPNKFSHTGLITPSLPRRDEFHTLSVLVENKTVFFRVVEMNERFNCVYALLWPKELKTLSCHVL